MPLPFPGQRRRKEKEAEEQATEEEKGRQRGQICSAHQADARQALRNEGRRDETASVE